MAQSYKKRKPLIEKVSEIYETLKKKKKKQAIICKIAAVRWFYEVFWAWSNILFYTVKIAFQGFLCSSFWSIYAFYS